MRFVISIFMCFPVLLMAQRIVDRSSNDRPDWLFNSLQSEYYYFYTGMGSNQDFELARQEAIADIFDQLVEEGTFNVSIHSTLTTSEQSQVIGQNSSVILREDFVHEVSTTGTAKSLSSLSREGIYWEKRRKWFQSEYWCWVLIKRPKSGKAPIIQQGYGSEGLWRSLILPGWGQYYKGERVKGRRLAIGELVTGGIAVLAFYFSDDFSAKAHNDLNYDNRKYYNDISSISYNIGVISSTLAVSLYCYNIFDVITSKGMKRYVQQVQHDVPNELPETEALIVVE